MVCLLSKFCGVSIKLADATAAAHVNLAALVINCLGCIGRGPAIVDASNVDAVVAGAALGAR